jgi:hypothetical protein
LFASSTKRGNDAAVELGAAFGEVRAAPVAELVVEDDGPPVAGEVGHRQEIVMRRTRTTVEHDQRRRPFSEAPSTLNHVSPSLNRMVPSRATA